MSGLEALGTHLGIDLEIRDGAWRELFGDRLADELMADGLARVERVGILPGGMASGRPALELAIALPDGRVVIAETSWRLMASAVRALEQRWPLEDGATS